MEMTRIEKAAAGKASREMRFIAREEKISLNCLGEGIKKGEIVIPYNSCRPHKIKAIGIGKGLRTKVNANLGTSPDCISLKKEIKKLEMAVQSGADAVMDLSVGGTLRKIRKEIIRQSPLPVGTVPIYQVAVNAAKNKGSIIHMQEDDIFEEIERQAAEGVDFITVHCGVTLGVLEALKKNRRVMGMVSRGGTFLSTWMLHHQKENPLYEDFDRLLGIAKKYDLCLSLGDGVRPGCLADSLDPGQIQELIILGQLQRRALKEGVQVLIEGPGHVPLNQIEAQVILEKEICGNAPFYVLGPLVTDIALGYDHISGAIGGAIAAAYGADFLCYVTPSEHLRLPEPEDVREGVIAAKIAAHAADIAKGIKQARDWDLNISRARHELNWKKMIKLALNPQKAEKLQKGSQGGSCTMCGKYCALKLAGKYFEKEKNNAAAR